MLTYSENSAGALASYSSSYGGIELFHTASVFGDLYELEFALGTFQKDPIPIMHILAIGGI